ncbi:hypothetical protein ACI2L4_00780 [Streptomyces sparsogenes]|uniref:hypothetical protein n=1 Tax=Streptomyces sparsogenes TaxID=67365 RepID=UPI0033EB550D
MPKLRKPTRGTVLRAGAAIAAAVALPVLASPNAHALAWDHTMHSDDGDPGARLRFEANGDIVEICDIEADGFAAYAEIYDYKTGQSRTLTVGGNGNCKRRDASDYGWNLVEGRKYGFTVALTEGTYIAYPDNADWTA